MAGHDLVVNEDKVCVSKSDSVSEISLSWDNKTKALSSNYDCFDYEDLSSSVRIYVGEDIGEENFKSFLEEILKSLD